MKEKTTCHAWKFISQNKHLICELQIEKRSNQEIVLSIPEYSQNTLDEIIGSEDRIQIYFEEEKTLELCVIRAYNDRHQITLDRVKKTKKINQRKHSRIKINKLIKFKIADSKGVVDQYFCHDISKEGLSVVLLNQQKNLFRVDEKYQLLTDDDEASTCEIKVKKIQKLKPYQISNLPYSQYKVSFELVSPCEYWDRVNCFFLEFKEA